MWQCCSRVSVSHHDSLLVADLALCLEVVVKELVAERVRHEELVPCRRLKMNVRPIETLFQSFLAQFLPAQHFLNNFRVDLDRFFSFCD